jgi:hypothetical protein
MSFMSLYVGAQGPKPIKQPRYLRPPHRARLYVVGSVSGTPNDLNRIYKQYLHRLSSISDVYPAAKMTSLYKQSIPVLIKYLKGLSGLLQKAEKFANEKGMKHDEMLTFRLISDMRG